MDPTQYRAELEAAVSAVQRACQICWNVQSTVSQGGSVEKGDCTPVTIADLSIQALLTLGTFLAPSRYLIGTFSVPSQYLGTFTGAPGRL